MFIKVLETKIPVKKTETIPIKKVESIAKKKTEQIKMENKTILENVLPLTEKQRAEFELFEKLINN